MKKKIVTLLATAAMTLAAANAFAAFSNGDLIAVMYDTSFGGAGSEIAYDLGSISSLAADSNVTVANLGTGSSTQYVQFFAINQTPTATDNISVAGTQALSYTKSSNAGASLRATTTYYAGLTASTNAYGTAYVNADKTNSNSLTVKGFQSAAAPGSFVGIMNASNSPYAYTTLADLTSPINFTLYSFANTKATNNGTTTTTPGVNIEIASNGDVIINAAQPPATPIPAAAYLLGSGLLGLLGFRRKNNA